MGVDWRRAQAGVAVVGDFADMRRSPLRLRVNPSRLRVKSAAPVLCGRRAHFGARARHTGLAGWLTWGGASASVRISPQLCESSL
jgi:hypothetical protein